MTLEPIDLSKGVIISWDQKNPHGSFINSNGKLRLGLAIVVMEGK